MLLGSPHSLPATDSRARIGMAAVEWSRDHLQTWELVWHAMLNCVWTWIFELFIVVVIRTLSRVGRKFAMLWP